MKIMVVMTMIGVMVIKAVNAVMTLLAATYVLCFIGLLVMIACMTYDLY